MYNVSLVVILVYLYIYKILSRLEVGTWKLPREEKPPMQWEGPSFSNL